MLSDNKYKVNFDEESIKKNIYRLTNQVWKLIPMKENNEDWAKQLDTVILELTGLTEIFVNHVFLLQSLSKLEGLKIEQDLNFEFYKKTVFECIAALQGAIK